MFPCLSIGLSLLLPLMTYLEGLSFISFFTYLTSLFLALLYLSLCPSVPYCWSPRRPPLLAPLSLLFLPLSFRDFDIALSNQFLLLVCISLAVTYPLSVHVDQSFSLPPLCYYTSVFVPTSMLRYATPRDTYSTLLSL